MAFLWYLFDDVHCRAGVHDHNQHIYYKMNRCILLVLFMMHLAMAQTWGRGNITIHQPKGATCIFPFPMGVFVQQERKLVLIFHVVPCCVVWCDTFSLRKRKQEKEKNTSVGYQFLWEGRNA